jgi:hypothetical protein
MGRAKGDFKRKLRVIVFHGMEDAIVSPINADQVIAQWARTNACVDGLNEDTVIELKPARVTKDAVEYGHRYTREVYCDNDGRAVMEKWIVRGMKHAWSGGAAVGSFTDPLGPSASEVMWRFFSEGAKVNHDSTHSMPGAIKVLYETVHHLHIRFRGWFVRHTRHTSGFSGLVTQSLLRSSSGSVASLAKPSRQLRHRQSL